MRHILNIYGPFLGAGVKVELLADDYSYAKVCLKWRFYSRNYVGTQFGGSIYSMTDPFYVLLLINRLGRDYIVWDKSAQIDYIKPGKGPLYAEFTVSETLIKEIQEKTQSGEKYLPNFTTEIIDASNQLIAKVNKTIYIRKKSS